MNKGEIADLFIRAAFIDSILPDTAAPKRLKAAWVQHAPLTEDDQRKWFMREETDKGRSKLLPGDDPMKDWWLEFWDGRTADMSRTDYGIWERANALITLVSDEGNRRALWAWAKAKAGLLEAKINKTRKTRRMGKVKIFRRAQKDASFAAWCRSEGIHEITGTRRKDRALIVISQHLIREGSPNSETASWGVLPVGAIFEHISDNIAADAPRDKGRTFERDRETVFAKEDAIFDWRWYRNEVRRQREAKRRQQQAA